MQKQSFDVNLTLLYVVAIHTHIESTFTRDI